MSFDVSMPDVLQYAYNFFASSLPLVWPFVGVTLAVVTISGLIWLFTRNRE